MMLMKRNVNAIICLSGGAVAETQAVPKGMMAQNPAPARTRHRVSTDSHRPDRKKRIVSEKSRTR